MLYIRNRPIVATPRTIGAMSEYEIAGSCQSNLIDFGRKVLGQTNDTHIRENWINASPVNLSQTVIACRDKSWIPSRVAHQTMPKDTSQMNNSCSTHSQSLKDEI